MCKLGFQSSRYIAILIGIKIVCDQASIIAGGRGNWTDRGCVTEFTPNSSTVVCKCSHLTNFAALVVSDNTIPL